MINWGYEIDAIRKNMTDESKRITRLEDSLTSIKWGLVGLYLIDISAHPKFATFYSTIFHSFFHIGWQ